MLMQFRIGNSTSQQKIECTHLVNLNLKHTEINMYIFIHGSYKYYPNTVKYMVDHLLYYSLCFSILII